MLRRYHIRFGLLLVGLLLLAGSLTPALSALPPAEPASSPAESAPMLAQQLEGAAAAQFLAREGILDQISTADGAESLPASLPGRSFLEAQPIAPADAQAGEQFGYSVAVDGNTLMVGAPFAGYGPGAVYVFTRNEAGSNVWTEQQKLLIANPGGSDALGMAIALEGDTALIGAIRAVYVFMRDGGEEDGIWIEKQKIVSGDDLGYSYFGRAVALDGDTAVVGDIGVGIGGNVGLGAAYVFVRSAAAGNVWSNQQRLMAGDGSGGDSFGKSVALDGDTIVIGADEDSVNGSDSQGSAYVFVRDDGQGSSGVWVQQQKLISDNGAALDRFGRAVALDDDTLMVAAPFHDDPKEKGGAVYVFQRSGAAGDDWVQQQMLTPAGGFAGATFGYRLALDGDTALISMPKSSFMEIDGPASACVFTRRPGGSTWGEAQELTTEPGSDYDLFGYSVAIDADTIVVGAPFADPGGAQFAGLAYATVRGPTPWPETSRISAGDSESGDIFGWSVALDGDTALIGAGDDRVGANAGQGSTYVFVRNDGAGGVDNWQLQQQLIAGDGAEADHFGKAVALQGNTAVVAARSDDVGAGVDQGSVYLFQRDTGGAAGGAWTELQKLTAGDGEANDFFGHALSLDGNTLFVGVPRDDVGANANQGSLYVFARGEGGAWSEQQKLTAGDGQAEDFFGVSVALDGDTAVTGAMQADIGTNEDQGAVYLFARNAGAWSELQKLTAGDGRAGDQFGASVALDGDTALAGAYWDDAQANWNQGSAHVFVRAGGASDGGVWLPQQKLTAPDGALGDNFGWSVALDGNIAVVGARQATVGVNASQGAAYVYVRAGSSWSWEQKLLAANGAPLVGAAGDLFGHAVALDGDTILIGAPMATAEGGPAGGLAHFFGRWAGTSWNYLPVAMK